jgi:hypothetical protein
MIDHGKNRVCDQIIDRFRRCFPEGGDIREVLRTTLGKKDFHSFDLWLWKYFVAAQMPAEKQAEAVRKCATLIHDRRAAPKLDAMLLTVDESPPPSDNSTAISEAARAIDNPADILPILDECGIFAEATP